MSVHRNMDHLDKLFASWTDALQEFIGAAIEGLRLYTPATTVVGLEADEDSAQVSIGIDGRWRYVTADVTQNTSGSPGIKDVFAVAVTENDFDGIGADPDETDYDFELRVITAGDTPTSVTAYRKIGEVDWDGSKIVGLRQTQGAQDVTLPLYPTAPNADSPALELRGVTDQAADILRYKNAALTTLSKVTAAGKIYGKGFDAGLELIRNVADPDADQDAATRKWVEDTITGQGIRPVTFTRDQDTLWVTQSGKVAGEFPVPVPSGLICKLIYCEHRLGSGADTVAKLQYSDDDGATWADVANYTGIAPTTTRAVTDEADVTFDDHTLVRLVGTIKGTGKGGFFTSVLKYELA